MKPNDANLRLLTLLELKRLTNPNTPIRQKDLLEHMENTYDITLNRNTFHTLLTSLTENNLPATIRVKKKSATQYYVDHYFSPAEMDYLLDMIYFARDLNYDQKRSLIEKLLQLIDDDYQKKHKSIHFDDLKNDRGLDDYFLRYATIQQAIFDHQRIQYTSKSGHTHVVSPLALIRGNDTVIVLTRVGNKDHVISLALFNLNALKILNQKSDSSRGLTDVPGQFNLKNFVDSHRDNWSGQLLPVRIKFDSYFKGNILRDFAPAENTFQSDPETDSISVNIQTTETAIVRYALENIDRLTVLSPPQVVEKIAEKLTAGLNKYSTAQK